MWCPWLDVDHKEALYWANQFFGSRPSLFTFYEAMLAQAWPEWRLRWASRGAFDFSAAMGLPFEALGRLSAPDSDSTERILGQIDEPWEDFATSRSPEDLAKLIAEMGEDTVRLIAETSFDTWATIRGEDGRLADHLLGHLWGHPPLTLGAPLVERLALRKPFGATGVIDEGDLKHTLLIDQRQRRVDWWTGVPDWLPAEQVAAPRWPGWTLAQHSGGPRRHLELTGRNPALIATPADYLWQQLAKTVELCLGPYAPVRMLERVAVRLAAEAPSGSTVTIERSATDPEEDAAAGSPELEATLAGWRQVFDRM